MTASGSDSQPLIEAANLRKVYRIYEKQASSLKEMVVRNFLAPAPKRDLVAVDGASFTLRRGECLGVIGSNGSGKSTLLKLLAGIIQPTSGTLAVRGRVASLIELGAGFQHEFTGMENIFLQGRILGLERSEILERLDDILEFSGLGDFIHTPIKRYSTGMIVRLGFAIAAHFDADIFLIDEVLSVGDAVFQERCLKRMDRLRKEGRAFVFVSHDMGQVEAVADEILWLDKGRTFRQGPADELIMMYHNSLYEAIQARAPDGEVDHLKVTFSPTSRLGSGEVLLRHVEFQRADGTPARRFFAGEAMRIVFDIEVIEPQPAIELQIAISSIQESHLFLGLSGQRMLPEFEPRTWRDLPRGRHRIAATIDPAHFVPGHYALTCIVQPPFPATRFFDVHLSLYRFAVVETPEVGQASRSASLLPPRWVNPTTPVYAPPFRWEIEGQPTADTEATAYSEVPERANTRPVDPIGPIGPIAEKPAPPEASKPRS